MNNNVQVSVNPTRTTTFVVSSDTTTARTSTPAGGAAGDNASYSSSSSTSSAAAAYNAQPPPPPPPQVPPPPDPSRHTTTSQAEKEEGNVAAVSSLVVKNDEEENKHSEEKMLIMNDDDDDEKDNRRPGGTGTTRAKVTFFDSSSNEEKDCWIHINNATFLGCGYQGQSFLAKMSCTTTTATTTTYSQQQQQENSLHSSSIQMEVVLKIATTTNLGFNAKYGPYEVIDTKEAIKDRQIYHTLFPPTSTSSSSTTSENNKMMRNHFYVTTGVVPEIPILKLYSSLSNNITDVQPECAELLEYKHRHRQQHQLHQAKNNQTLLKLTGTICDVAKGIPFDKYYNITSTTTTTTATTTTTTNAATTTNTTKRQQQHINHHHHRKKRRAIIIVKQLICIWRHKYQHRFLHEDIVFNHIYLDATTGHVGLIDFQQADMLDYYSNSNSNSYGGNSGGEDSDNIESVVKHARDWLKVINQVVGNDNQNKIDRLVQMMQLYQLLQVISNVCMGTIDYINVGYKANLQLNQALSQWKRKKRIWKSMEDHIQEIQFALQECNNEFKNNNSSLLSPGVGIGGGRGDDPLPPIIIIKEIPVMLYDRYKHVLLLDENNNATTTTTTSNVEDENDRYDVVVGQLYDMLLQWVNNGNNNGAGDDDDVC